MMTNGYKLAALRLKGISDEDRLWALAHFPDSERQLIEDYICELEGFDLDESSMLVQELMNESTLQNISQSRITQVEGDDELYRILNRANLADIKRLLQGLPLQLVASVLSERRWSWRNKYLQSLPGSRRQELEKLILDKPEQVGVKARMVLLETMAEELDGGKRRQNRFESLLQKQARKSSSRKRSWRRLWLR